MKFKHEAGKMQAIATEIFPVVNLIIRQSMGSTENAEKNLNMPTYDLAGTAGLLFQIQNKQFTQNFASKQLYYFLILITQHIIQMQSKISHSYEPCYNCEKLLWFDANKMERRQKETLNSNKKSLIFYAVD